jgi:hypothetical protein
MPPGHWHELAATISRQKNNTLTQNARLFALVSLAQADAAIICWEAKYRHNLWRPVTAIQRADVDDNPSTAPDKSWEQLLPAPPFPSYTSGHSTFSKASAQVLFHFYGTDAISFTAISDTLPGVFRRFTSLTACADEVGMSRIYGGIHFQFDNVAGKQSGGKVGDYVSANFLLPNAELPRLLVESTTADGASLRVHGHIGRECVTEASPDRTHWKAISTNQATVGGVAIIDKELHGRKPRFYQVRER